MYRAVTWMAMQRGVNLDDAEALTRLASSLSIELVPGEASDRLLVNGQDVTEHLRRPEVERNVSLVAKVPGVREAMVKLQRAIARQDGIVMVGRDIGTVVLPNARVKVFLKASVEVRARRRYLELKEKGASLDYQQVLEDLQRRDKIDSERTDSPLKPADDAVQIQTDNLGIEEVAEKILSLVGQPSAISKSLSDHS